MLTKQRIERESLHLAHDIYTIAETAVKKRGRRLSWLRFARPTLTGWSFFKRKKVPWEVLGEIHENVQRLHTTCCTKASVADTFSQLINLSPRMLHHLSKSL